jgi:hypothetical protein
MATGHDACEGKLYLPWLAKQYTIDLGQCGVQPALDGFITKRSSCGHVEIGLPVKERTDHAGERPSVAAGRDYWRDAFLLTFAVLALVKVFIATRLSPFGDEAFYWMESGRLAWGYSDLPPLTAWLIAAGEAVVGHGVFGMRLPFLLIGSTLPWLLVALGRQLGGTRAGWQAGLLCMALPLAGTLGVLALPDVPLTVAIMMATLGLVNALERDRWRDWLLLAAGLGVAWLTHYRAAMPMLAGLVLFTLFPRGRAQWRNGKFYVAMLVALVGLVPLAVFNIQQRGVGIGFQLVERNPWAFHPDALVQPLEQALACTPLLYAVLLWAAWASWKRRNTAPFDVVAAVSGTFILAYFVFGLFADDVRFRAHWPLPGYLPLLAVLPVLRARRFLALAFAVAALGTAIGLGYLWLAASPTGPGVLAGVKAFPSNFTGWRESARAVQQLHDVRPDAVLVADNFMLAAELRFQLGPQATVYSLDSPLNTKHGRAPQLALWQLDEAGLRAAHAGQEVLLAVDETSLRERERAAWLDTLPARVAGLQLAGRLDLFDGRRRFVFYRAVAR